MTFESIKYYFANPTIYLFPRSLKYLLKEEKKTVYGVETAEKKCELNDILTTLLAPGENNHFEPSENRQFQPNKKSHCHNS